MFHQKGQRFKNSVLFFMREEQAPPLPPRVVPTVPRSISLYLCISVSLYLNIFSITAGVNPRPTGVVSPFPRSSCRRMYFSVRDDRKVPKERHPRREPTVPSLGILPPHLRISAVRSQSDGWPRCRQNADHLGLPPNRGDRPPTAIAVAANQGIIAVKNHAKNDNLFVHLKSNIPSQGEPPCPPFPFLIPPVCKRL